MFRPVSPVRSTRSVRACALHQLSRLPEGVDRGLATRANHGGRFLGHDGQLGGRRARHGKLLHRPGGHGARRAPEAAPLGLADPLHAHHRLPDLRQARVQLPVDLLGVAVYDQPLPEPGVVLQGAQELRDDLGEALRSACAPLGRHDGRS